MDSWTILFKTWKILSLSTVHMYNLCMPSIKMVAKTQVTAIQKYFVAPFGFPEVSLPQLFCYCHLFEEYPWAYDSINI